MEGMTSLEREISRLHDEILESPDSIELKLKYGHACLMRDWRLEALRVYQEVLNEEENAAARLALVKIFAIQGYYPEAYAELRKLFAIDPINLQGHIMLHILKEYEPIPEDLAQHCEFIPSLQYLNEQVALLLRDRDLLDSQIAEYSALVFGVTEPEPILQYFVLETRKSKERLVKLLAKCDEWSKNAVDSGDYSNYEPYSETNYAASSAHSEDNVSVLSASDLVSSSEESDLPASEATETDSLAQEPLVPNEETNAPGSSESAADTLTAESEAQEAQPEELELPAQQAEEPDNSLTEEAISVAAESSEIAGVPVADSTVELGQENIEQPISESQPEGELVAAENIQEVAQKEETVSEVPAETAEVPSVEAAEPNVDTAMLTSLLEPILSTRGGVSSALLYRRNYGVLASVGPATDKVSAFMAISVGMDAWSSLDPDVNCWILEGSGGMVYIQKLTRDNLLIIDSTSTNLGALRISVEKIIPGLEEAL
ncbi:MAG: hypothetical protein Q4F00_11245 [bacterium]|nr:hypothetical protein [bacterium]